MSHKRLYAQGKISLREFRELSLLKARFNNPAFTKGARRMYKREYKQREKEYGKR